MNFKNVYWLESEGGVLLHNRSKLLYYQVRVSVKKFVGGAYESLVY